MEPFVNQKRYRKFQQKILAAPFTSVATATDLSFTNLIPGKWYYLLGHFIIQTTAGGDLHMLIYNSNGSSNKIGRITTGNDGAVVGAMTRNYFAGIVFQAVDSNLQFTVTTNTSSSSLNGDGTVDATFVQLIEMPDMIHGSDW